MSVALLAAAILPWTLAAAPSSASASPVASEAAAPAVRPVAAGDTAPGDTILDGPGTAVYGHVVEHGNGNAVGQANLLFRRIIRDSVVDFASTSTDGDGAFRLDEVPTGTYLLVTDHLGFESRRDTVQVPVGRTVQLEVTLAAEPVKLRPLDVSVRQEWLVETGFYERREKGLGKFLTAEELEKRPLSSLTQALSTVSGVKTAQRCRGMFCREVLHMSQSSTQMGCDVKYYMDGNEMHGFVSPDNIAVHNLAAIEVYRGISETPGQFYGRCGSVVIWSKRSDG